MNTTQQGIILLMKSAVTGECFGISDDLDWEMALAEINRHKIHTLVFQGALNCGIPRNHPVMQQLFQHYCKALMVSEGQIRELQRIYQAFDENGIDYMPLKGCNMKARYPKPELRIMGDADILIRVEQYEKIVPVMESLGFTFKCESDHELIWQSGSLYLELHKRLIPSYQKHLCVCFENYWERAVPAEGNRYGMAPEDEWIYLFSHFAKHFRDSGIGCRHVTDLWVFLQKYPDMNADYVASALKELQLLEFYENVRRLLAVWFCGETPDATTDILTEYIFASGSWGDATAGVISGIIRNYGDRSCDAFKLRYLWSYAFPKPEVMQRRHKILKSAPWLQPVLWAVRLVYKVLFDKKDLQKRKRDLAVITKGNIQKRQEFLHFVGLDYH